MKFVIGASNLKVFAKSILALSKIGDELYIEPLQNCLTIRTVNSSKSAFACYSFKQSFFLHFQSELSSKNHLNDQSLLNNNNASRVVTGGGEDETDCSVLDDQLEPFKCKVPAKCLLSIFKNINSLEKNVDKCTITVKYVPLSQDTVAKAYDYDSTMTASKLVSKNKQLYDTKFLIIMNSKHGMRKTFILSISDCENLQAAFSTENCTNRLNIGARYLFETINSFSNDTEEVSFVVEEQKIVIRNYVEPDTDTKGLINTQVNFDSDEFNNYEIEKETDITFGLKEFKVCLTFGHWFELGLDIYFQRKGRPVIFKYNSSHYEANFTLATLSEDSVTTQNTTYSSHYTSQTNPATNRAYLSNISNRPAPTRLNAKDNPRSTANKRPLVDSSLQVYLNSSNNSMPADTTTNRTELAETDDEEDDVLLSQALVQHEQSVRSQTQQVQKQQKRVCTPPPSKKMRSSLVQSLFEEEDSSQTSQLDQSTSTSTILNSGSKIKGASVTLARLLEDNQSSDDEENNRTMTTRPVYIEETDSE